MRFQLSVLSFCGIRTGGLWRARKRALGEPTTPNLQLLVLRWTAEGELRHREIVRQQYNFSPPHTTSEIEDYKVDLYGATELELVIKPDINEGQTCASLVQLRLA